VQVALISKALPPKPSANGSAASMEVDEDLTEDVALRSIDDMGAENQRRCVLKNPTKLLSQIISHIF